ncbi:hypothetical protein ILYODFUR_024518 [Ilyodon furcidens]|uniref:Uncharacterized protein n=1 Tax=Ilyodon furcidens TaxID=33524 RepID=A0ABV0TYL9_9TELE
MRRCCRWLQLQTRASHLRASAFDCFCQGVHSLKQPAAVGGARRVQCASILTQGSFIWCFCWSLSAYCDP